MINRWRKALAGALVLAGCSDDSAAARHEDQAALQMDLEAVQKTVNVIGALAEVQTPDGSMRARTGVSELGKPDPVPWDSEFRVASTTKTFVATALLQLVGEGRLGLDDTVEKWLPGVVVGNGNDGSKISIRNLLQQTSGIYDYVADPDLREALARDFPRACLDREPPEAFVAIALKHPPLFAPGTEWRYSNTNYLLAGMILSKAAGRDWKEQVEQRIIAPLGLGHTLVTREDPSIPGPHAHSYLVLQGAPEPIDATDCTLEHTADSAIISTTADLNTFFRALMTGKLLRPQELTEMQKTTPSTADDAQFPNGRYGLGIRWTPLSCGGGYWHHEGDSPTGFATRTGVTADGQRSVVVMTTSTIDLVATNAAIAALTDRALCDRPRD